MFHKQALMTFYQRDWEPLYNAWWRCKKFLAWFFYHGMPKEWILENFLNGLCYTSREWVERGNLFLPIIRWSSLLHVRRNGQISLLVFEWFDEKPRLGEQFDHFKQYGAMDRHPTSKYGDIL